MPDGIEATAQDGNLTLTGTVKYGRQHTGVTVARVPTAPTHRAEPAALPQAPTITDLPKVGQGGRAWAGARREGTGLSARTSEVLAAVMTLAAMARAMLATLRLTLVFLSRRRLAAWETAWSRVGPQWSNRRP